jgi:dTDP-4-dehydrorhamnose reductase
MRVLVTGASGLLGGRLALVLSRSHEVVGSRHRTAVDPGLPAVDMDLLSAASVAGALAEIRPDAVVHSAALADPDLCEREPERAAALNVEATRNLASACRRAGLRLVGLSTDLVLGEGRSPWDEAAPTRPLLAYGLSKRAGEMALLAEHPAGAVVRVALVHGRGHGPRATASESVAWGLREGRPLRLYTDQYRTPVDPESVADALERLLAGSGSGVYHLGGRERISRYELGLRTARLLGLDPSRIEPVRFADQVGAAPRPADVSLDSSRAMRDLGWAPRPLDVGILEGRPAREA